MKHNPINLIFCSLLAITLGLFANSCNKDLNKGNANATLSKAVTSFHLVWSDRFNGASVNESKWHIDNGNPGVNNEKEFFQ